MVFKATRLDEIFYPAGSQLAVIFVSRETFAVSGDMGYYNWGWSDNGI